MRKLATLMAATAAFALAPAAASAADIYPGNPTMVPSAFFIVSGDITNGPISASYGRSGLGAGSFTDVFYFTIDQTGLGSGSITTSFSGAPMSMTDLDFTSVVFNNGTSNYAVPTSMGNTESGGLTDVPISFGVQNSLTVSYLSRGQGSYGGQLTFTPNEVPEPSAWALMLLGFGGMGLVIRRRKQRTGVAYAF